jgi:hypothetical protein
MLFTIPYKRGTAMDQSFIDVVGFILAVAVVLIFGALFAHSLVTRLFVGGLGFVMIFAVGYLTLQAGNQAAWITWITPIVGGNILLTWIPLAVVVVSAMVAAIVSGREKKR